MFVVASPNLHKCGSQLAQVPETPDPQKLFLQCTEETFDASVAFRLTYERGRRLDSQELDLRLEIVAHVDAAVVVAQSQTCSDAGCRVAEVLVHSLADRLQCFKPRGFFDSMDFHTFCGAVDDAGEDGDRTLGFGEGRRGIGTPHLIRRLGHDRPFMRVATILLW